MEIKKNWFSKAKPIWIKDREREMNLTVGFKSVFKTTEGKKYDIKITASSLYRLFVNNQFVFYGPARAPHGYMRIDVLDITEYLSMGSNTIAIEVAGYNCYSYYTLNSPSFLQAEKSTNLTIKIP